MTQIANGASEHSPWSPREGELLAVTKHLLQQLGYERLTVEAVASAARASKATVYRRWPSKAELVLAAFIEGVRCVPTPPDTGTLRDDLLQIGQLVCCQAEAHASMLRAVLVEAQRNPALDDAMQQFLDHRRVLIRCVLQQAVGRGEIDNAALNDEFWDLLPGYLMFRCLLPGHPIAHDTVQLLVDEVLLPYLTRPNR